VRASDQFIAETLGILATDTDEIVVEAAKAFRGNPARMSTRSSMASISKP
jgi:hypothetical protein